MSVRSQRCRWSHLCSSFPSSWGVWQAKVDGHVATVPASVLHCAQLCQASLGEMVLGLLLHCHRLDRWPVLHHGLDGQFSRSLPVKILKTHPCQVWETGEIFGLWLQKKLHLIWLITSRDVSQWLNCIVGKLGTGFWKAVHQSKALPPLTLLDSLWTV